MERTTAAQLLIWIVPPMIVGTYMLVASQLLRWEEGELLVVEGAALAAGLAGICMLPIRLWQRALLAVLYLPLMGGLLFLFSFHALGCGVFGHCL